MDTPQVLIAEEPPKPGFRFPLPKIPVKNLLFIAVIIIIPAILLLLSFKLDLKNPLASKTEPKLIKQGNVADPGSQIQNHPQLFYAYLEYDPKTNLVTQLATARTNGDKPTFLPEQPAASSNLFIYKIELVSEKNVLLETGWDTKHKSIITTDKNTYKFRVMTSFYPNASIRVYSSDNKLIWTGIMK